MPGGYVELVESGTEGFCDDRTMAEDNGAKRHFDLQIKAMTEIGRAPVTEAILRVSMPI